MNISSCCLLLANIVLAAVPHKFVAGDPARADSINENFEYLDKSIRDSTLAMRSAITAGPNLNNYATIKNLKDSANAIRTSIPSLVPYAKTEDLNLYVKASVMTDYALKSSLSGFASIKLLDSVSVKLDAKVDRINAVEFGADGVSDLPNGKQIIFRPTAMGSYYYAGSGGFGFSHFRGDMSFTFMESDLTAGMALFETSRGVKREIFNTSGNSVSFQGRVDVLGDLYVNSKLIASGIPSSAVADYVFEPEYRLAPLSEVEVYTKANKHLPEVPSAAEISNGGMDLAKMNLILLKKVEELTLHAIAQQKEIEAIKASFQGLQLRGQN